MDGSRIFHALSGTAPHAVRSAILVHDANSNGVWLCHQLSNESFLDQTWIEGDDVANNQHCLQVQDMNSWLPAIELPNRPS